jgi:hypothetical protein
VTRRVFIAIVALLLVIIGINYATTYTRRWGRFTINISPPSVWFEDPQYPNVVVELSNYKTRALVNISARNMGARLVNRTGLFYNLTLGRDYVLQYFEECGRECDFYYTSDGSGIKATGNPRGGLYRGCTLRYRHPLGVATNISFTALMKTDDPDPPVDGIRGVSLWNGTTGYYYLAGIKNNGTGWFFGIYKYNETIIREPGGWVLPALRDAMLTGVVTGVWFSVSIMQIAYPNGTYVIRAWLYNVTGGGRLVAYIEVVDYQPISADNFGLTVYQIRNRSSAVFQIIGFTMETRILIIIGLPYCCWVYVYDPAGNKIGEGHINETGSTAIELFNPAVGNATLRVVCGDYEYNTTVSILLGGDAYEIYFWFEGPILMIYTSILDANFTGWLSVLNANCNGSIYSIDFWLVNATTSSTRARVVQVGNYLLIYPGETSMLVFTPSPTGWVGSISARAELFYNTACTLNIVFYYNYTTVATGGLKAEIYVKGT